MLAGKYCQCEIFWPANGAWAFCRADHEPGEAPLAKMRLEMAGQGHASRFDAEDGRPQ